MVPLSCGWALMYHAQTFWCSQISIVLTWKSPRAELCLSHVRCLHLNPVPSRDAAS